MQKTKVIFKKILICLVAVLMCLSPVLLAGCGDKGGGTSTPPTNPSTPSTPPETPPNDNPQPDPGDDPYAIVGAEYLSNYKITYRPGEEDEISAFMADIKVQINEIAFDIIRQLYANYGYAYNDVAFNDVNVVNIVINDSGVYEQTLVPAKNDSILKNSKPLFSSDMVIPNADFSVGYKYDTTAHYAKYFNHTNAIFADYSLSGVLNSWNWNGGLTYDVDNPPTVADTINAFVNNLVYRKQLEFALLLISAGYDITPTGNNYLAYLNGASMISDFAKDYGISSTSYEKAIEFYNEVDARLFNTYLKLADHSGYTDNEINHVSNFIQNEIIGTSLVSLDNQKFVNIKINKNDNFSPVTVLNNSKYTKFLNEESFATVYYTDDDSVVNNLGEVAFYQQSPSTEGLEEAEAKKLLAEAYMINDLASFAKQFIYAQAKRFSQDTGNTITNSVTLMDNEGTDLIEAQVNLFYELFIDVNGDKVYTADFWDIDADDNTTNVIYDKIDGTEIFVFSIRKQYFKNYTNTAYEIASKVLRAPKDETISVSYAQKTFDFELKYPVIPASYFADYVNDDILLNENGQMNMPTGYKRYQNMVIMPKQTFSFEEFYIFMTRQNDTTGVMQDFNVTIYLRYYDAETNTFATWGDDQNKTQFYSVGTISVNIASNLAEIADPLQVNLKEILPVAKIKDTPKGNCILPKFDNLPAGNANSPTLITKSHQSATEFKFVDLPNGQRTVTYNPESVDEQNRTSYLELLFATDNDNNFQLALMPFEVNP